MHNVVQHSIVHFVHTAGNWLQQTTASYNSIELKRNTILFERLQHQLLSELELVDDAGILCQLFHRMTDSIHQYLLLVVIYGNLGRGRTRIDYQYSLHNVT